jgi:hypothetical protein
MNARKIFYRIGSSTNDDNAEKKVRASIASLDAGLARRKRNQYLRIFTCALAGIALLATALKLAGINFSTIFAKHFKK